MKTQWCKHCRRSFRPSRKKQVYCNHKECQKKRKARWQKAKMKRDPDYSENQKLSQQKWTEQRPGYWSEYRKKNAYAAEINRIRQRERDQSKRKTKPPPFDLIVQNKEPILLAKIEVKINGRWQPMGEYALVKRIAKMDAKMDARVSEWHENTTS